MNEQKSLVYRLAEAYERHRVERRAAATEQGAQLRAQLRPPGNLRRLARWLTPNGGTLLLIAALILTQNVWARTEQSAASAPGPSATTVNYQGRLADSGGAPLDGSYGMSFALYDALSGGGMVWGPENHTAVPVSEGLFSVGLGSLTGGGIPTSVWDGDRYLEITVGGETLSPRELIRSVPIAGMALTVPDGAVTASKLSATATGKWTMFDNSQLVVHHSGGGSFDWQVADISAFVPASAEIAYIHVFQKETAGNGACTVRPYGSTSNAGLIQSRTPLANQYNSEIGLVAVSESKFEYRCSLQSGATISDMGIELWGYYEPGY